MSPSIGPNEALALIPGWDAGSTAIEELGGGLTNRTFLLRSGGNQSVLRLHADTNAAVAPDRYCELTVMTEAAAAGLAPNIIFSDIEHGILVTDYLPDPVWSLSDLQTAGNLEALAELLRRVHALPVCGSKFDLNMSAARYEEFLQGRHGLHAYASRCVDVIAAMPAGDQSVCCHNDIVADNIISSQPLKLIDWEYASDNDAFFDLASVICFHNLDQEATDVLLNAYSGGTSAEHRERLADQMRAFDAIQWLWLASRHLHLPRHENLVRLEELQQRIG